MTECLDGMTPYPSNALLARYASGECSEDEVRALVEWAAGDSAREAQLDDVRAVWAARRPAPAWDVAGMWEVVQGSMQGEARRPVRREPIFRFGQDRRHFGAVMAAAAVVALVIGGGMLARANDWGKPAAITAIAMREYVTPRGQRATLQLADGTRLTLAPESRLRIPEGFGRTAREVVLEGEALFDVVHDTTLPFRVRAKHAVAEDIGTRFSVRAYPEDSVVTVAVAEGIVALGAAETSSSGAAQGIILDEGKLGALGPAGQVTMDSGPRVAAYLAWADGTMAFADTPLRDVIIQLRRWHDVNLRLASDTIGARRVTAVFKNESATETVHFIASILNLIVDQSGSHYTLRAQ